MKKKETKEVPEKNKGGGQRKEIDYETFEKLCSIQCTEEEICEYLGVTVKTLNLRLKEQYGEGFSKVFKAKRKLGIASLRRTQFKLAEKNAAMAIFLGKNLLNQTDRGELTMKGGLSAPKELKELEYNDLIRECKKRGIAVPD